MTSNFDSTSNPLVSGDINSANPASSTFTDNQEILRRLEHHENIEEYYNMFERTYKEKIAQTKENNTASNKMEELLKRFNSELSEIGVASASLPPRQN